MIVLCIGTRPDIIKMASLYHALKEEKANFCVYHTNQHKNDDMSRIFLEQMGFDSHDISYAQTEDPSNPAELYSRVMLDAYNRFDLMVRSYGKVTVCVYGDVLSALACGVAAKMAGATLVHVESGYRSYDITMPEEMTRMTLDSLSDILFVPTSIQAKNLEREYNHGEMIVSGNTVVDAVEYMMPEVDKLEGIMGEEPYVLATFHRPENVDDRHRLAALVDALSTMEFKVIWPIHPRTIKKMKLFDLKLPSNISVIDPLPYVKFLRAMKDAKAIVTDSGGIQEETMILEKPCVIIRKNTERVETLGSGIHKLFNLEWTEKLVDAVIEVITKRMENEYKEVGIKSPYGSDVGKLIAKRLLEE